MLDVNGLLVSSVLVMMLLCAGLCGSALILVWKVHRKSTDTANRVVSEYGIAMTEHVALIGRLSSMIMSVKVVGESPGLAVNMLREQMPPMPVPPQIKPIKEAREEGVRIRMSS
jgi:hypothetical protein